MTPGWACSPTPTSAAYPATASRSTTPRRLRADTHRSVTVDTLRGNRADGLVSPAGAALAVTVVMRSIGVAAFGVTVCVLVPMTRPDAGPAEREKLFAADTHDLVVDGAHVTATI